MRSNKLCIYIYFISLRVSVTNVFSKTDLRLSKYPPSSVAVEFPTGYIILVTPLDSMNIVFILKK